jgi:hypothetical protein
MPALKNPKHERFCVEIVNGRSAEEAAREVGLFPKSNPGSFKAQACRLSKRKEIARRITALSLRGETRIAKDFKVTREWLIAELVTNALQARQSGQISASNKALEMLGNNAGGDCSFVQRTEVTVWDGDLSTLTDDQLRRMAEHFERLAFGQDQARLLAEKRRVLAAAGAVVDVEATAADREVVEINRDVPEPSQPYKVDIVTPTSKECLQVEVEDPLEGL